MRRDSFKDLLGWSLQLHQQPWEQIESIKIAGKAGFALTAVKIS